jgi:uncharacterized protein (DUF58 family)
LSQIPISAAVPGDHAPTRLSRTAAGIRRWFRPPRRLRFARSGAMLTGGALVLGFAAVGTGNNLLFLVLGGVLGFIALSGWMSEQMIRGLQVRRRVARGITAGEPARIAYEVRNGKRRLPSFAVEIGEAGMEAGWIPIVETGETASARAEGVWARRGIHPLETVTLATSFPFGLFRKERDLEIPGEVVVWPRHDRAVREPRPAGERVRRSGETVSGSAGARGEYRGLRPYRAGDDPRDVHWRTTARVGSPVVREYERDRAQALWLCLDLSHADGDAAEAAAETCASLAAQAARRGDAFALATPDLRVTPGTGPAQLERVLDALARARFRPAAPRVEPPAPPAQCVLVTASSTSAGAWGDVFGPAREAR